MRAEPTVHSESDLRIEAPAFRVNFWERPHPNFGWNLDAWILLDAAGVSEVLSWIAENSAGRPYELFVETAESAQTPFEVPRTSSLVRLSGYNPNET
jgi:hypothetical protein